MKRFLMIGLALCSMGCGNDNNTTITGIDPSPSPTVQPPIGRLATYLLSANGSPSSSIDVFRVDTATGALTRAATQPTGFGLVSLEQHPVQPFIYAGGFESNQVLGFRMEPSTGQLTPLAGFPVPSQPENNVVLDRTGNFLYSLGETTIDGFRVNQTTGGLTPLAGFPITGFGELINADFDVDNRFLYVADNGPDQVISLSLNAQTGTLTEVARVSPGPDPYGVEVDPNNQSVYVSLADGNLNGFSRNANGSLTQLAGLPVRYAPPGSRTPRFDFRDRTLFIGDRTSSTLNAFSIGTGGQLTPVAGYPVPGGSGDLVSYPLPIAPFLYVGDRPATRINTFRVGANASVTQLPSTVGGNPNEVLPVVLTY